MPNTPNLRALLTVTIAAGISLASADAFGALPPVNTGSTSFMELGVPDVLAVLIPFNPVMAETYAR